MSQNTQETTKVEPGAVTDQTTTDASRHPPKKKKKRKGT